MYLGYILSRRYFVVKGVNKKRPPSLKFPPYEDFSSFFNDNAAAVKFNFLLVGSTVEESEFFFSSCSSGSVLAACFKPVNRLANFSVLMAPLEMARNLFLEFMTR